jgi:hypothetical protein
MARSFSTSTVTYTFVAPDDPDQKKVNHKFNNLIESPDEAKLIAIGEALKKVIPYQDLVDITIDEESILTADAPAAGATTATPDAGADDQATNL